MQGAAQPPGIIIKHASPLREHGVSALVTAFYVVSLVVLQLIVMPRTRDTVLSSC